MAKSDRILMWALVIGISLSLLDHEPAWFLVTMAFWLGYIYDRTKE